MLLTVALALLSVFGLGADRSQFAGLTKFHPAERVVEHHGMPLVTRTPSGGSNIRQAHMWVRVFKFRKLTPSLLKTLRKMVVRTGGVTYDAPGKGMTIRLRNGRDGYFDYASRELTFDNEPAPDAGRRKVREYRAFGQRARLRVQTSRRVRLGLEPMPGSFHAFHTMPCLIWLG